MQGKITKLRCCVEQWVREAGLQTLLTASQLKTIRTLEKELRGFGWGRTEFENLKHSVNLPTEVEDYTDQQAAVYIDALEVKLDNEKWQVQDRMGELKKLAKATGKRLSIRKGASAKEVQKEIDKLEKLMVNPSQLSKIKQLRAKLSADQEAELHQMLKPYGIRPSDTQADMMVLLPLSLSKKNANQLIKQLTTLAHG